MENSKEKQKELNYLYNELNVKMIVLQQNILNYRYKQAKEVIQRIIKLMKKMDGMLNGK